MRRTGWYEGADDVTEWVSTRSWIRSDVVALAAKLETCGDGPTLIFANATGRNVDERAIDHLEELDQLPGIDNGVVQSLRWHRGETRVTIYSTPALRIDVTSHCPGLTDWMERHFEGGLAEWRVQKPKLDFAVYMTIATTICALAMGVPAIVNSVADGSLLLGRWGATAIMLALVAVWFARRASSLGLGCDLRIRARPSRAMRAASGWQRIEDAAGRKPILVAAISSAISFAAGILLAS